jgi:hypothetical protein
MDDPEKLAIQGTQHEEKQNKNTTQYIDFFMLNLRKSAATNY